MNDMNIRNTYENALHEVSRHIAINIDLPLDRWPCVFAVFGMCLAAVFMTKMNCNVRREQISSGTKKDKGDEERIGENRT